MKHRLAFCTALVFALGFFFVTLCVPVMRLYAQSEPSDSGDSGEEDINDLFEFGDDSSDSADGEKENPVFNPYDPKYRPMAAIAAQDKSGIKSLLPNNFYGLTFLHVPDATANDLTLRLITPGTVSGCLKTTPASVVPNIIGRSLTLELTESKMEIDNSIVRYALHSCDLTSHTSITDATINLEELRQKKIESLSMTAKSVGRFASLKLVMDTNKITITSDMGRLNGRASEKAQCQGENKPEYCTYTYWLYPKGTYTLISNALTKNGNDALVKQIKVLARSKGLTPLEEILPDFKNEQYQRDLVYVVDDKSLFSGKVKALDDRYLLGNVRSSETFYGPQGPYERVRETPVYAKLPGIYE